MKRKLVKTSDGSNTLFVPELNEHYHSVHGAYAEAMHVFIKNGLYRAEKKELSILEIGMGTGLNIWLTVLEALESEMTVRYFATEPYPVENELIEQMSYTSCREGKGEEEFRKIHQLSWHEWHSPWPELHIYKAQQKALEIRMEEQFDVIYFDAFAPQKQPDLWELPVFEKLYSLTKPGGFLTTYCAQGEFRRRLKAAGFSVVKTEGPPGKREMTIAIKEPS